jgi:PPOX class probable F420-dependent enzyme
MLGKLTGRTGMRISTQKYVRLTTFTEDKRPKHTPVWIARLREGVIGATTDDDSWKVKRLKKTPNIELAPCDIKGNVADGIETLSGSAKIMACTDMDYAKLEAAFIEKYGIQYRLARFIRKLRGKTACGIAITLD